MRGATRRGATNVRPPSLGADLPGAIVENPQAPCRARGETPVQAGSVGESGERPFTSAEAAAYLGVSERVVIEACCAGRLPARRLSRKWRLLPSALRGWLASAPVLEPAPARPSPAPPTLPERERRSAAAPAPGSSRGDERQTLDRLRSAAGLRPRRAAGRGGEGA